MIAVASELTGDTDRAIYWFMNEPIATLKSRTAAELVGDGHADAVLAHLQELLDGANG